jgi:hypothetical protein
LIAKVLGGMGQSPNRDGTERRNLVPMWGRANTPEMKDHEMKLRDALDAAADECIAYVVKPEYPKRVFTALPTRVVFSAVGRKVGQDGKKKIQMDHVPVVNVP